MGMPSNNHMDSFASARPDGTFFFGHVNKHRLRCQTRGNVACVNDGGLDLSLHRYLSSLISP